MRSKTVFIIAAAVIGLSFVELVSFIAFTVFDDRFTFVDPARFALTADDDIEALRRRYDERLGWDNHYDTPLGERPRPVSYGRPLIACFGDSYTHCDEVGDDETWQTHLAAILGADVYNFGTAGFGTDQAYLKYLAVRERLTTPVVVLGLISENINRIVSVYRPFYFAETGIKLPKPRFELAEGRLVPLANPLKGADELHLLGSESFIHRLGEHDYWYNRDDYPVRAFPYTGILFNRRTWLEAVHGRSERRPDDTDPRPWENLWTDRAVSELMFAVLGSFIDTARESGSIPVVLILPMQDEVFERHCTGRTPMSVSMVEEYCERRRCLSFNGIDALAAHVDSMEEIPRLYYVHLSPTGNRVMARALGAFVTERVLPLLKPPTPQ